LKTKTYSIKSGPVKDKTKRNSFIRPDDLEDSEPNIVPADQLPE
jgi:hypothetical protein